MKKTIDEHYCDWVDEKESRGAFSRSSDWKGDMVKGFIQYILAEEDMLPNVTKVK